MLNKTSHRTKPFHPHGEHVRSCVPRLGSRGTPHPLFLSEEAQSEMDPCCMSPGSSALAKRSCTGLVIKGELNLHLRGVLALCRPWLKIFRASEVNMLLLEKEKGQGKSQSSLLCSGMGELMNISPIPFFATHVQRSSLLPPRWQDLPP